jgi:xanthine dehydrogenase YagS FAD-binding subunit
VAGDHRYYFSILQMGTCIASHPSDLAPALTAVGASLSIVGSQGVRTVSIEKFFNGPNDVLDNILQPDELLFEIHIPKDFDGAKGTYLKDAIRETWDLSLASAAIILKMSGGKCCEARIVLGGVALSPYRAEEAERMLKSSRIDEEVAGKTAEKALQEAKGLQMTKYKLRVAQAVVKRAILKAAQQGQP